MSKCEICDRPWSLDKYNTEYCSFHEAASDLLEACLMEEKAITLFDIWEQSGNSQTAWDAWQHTYHQSIKLRRAAIAKAKE